MEKASAITNHSFEIPIAPVSLTPKDFIDLLELTHELSNSVGLTMNLLISIPVDLPQPICDQLTTAMEEATRATCTLRKLMWRLGDIRLSAQGLGPAVGHTGDAR